MNRTPNKDGTVTENSDTMKETRKFVSDYDRQKSIEYQSAMHDATSLISAMISKSTTFSGDAVKYGELVLKLTDLLLSKRK